MAHLCIFFKIKIADSVLSASKWDYAPVAFIMIASALSLSVCVCVFFRNIASPLSLFLRLKKPQIVICREEEGGESFINKLHKHRCESELSFCCKPLGVSILINHFKSLQLFYFTLRDNIPLSSC